MASRSLGSLPKKRKSAGPTDNLHEIEKLERQLTAAVSANSSLNALVDLLDIANAAEDAAVLSKAVFALYRVFVLLLSSGKLSSGRGSDDETKTVRTWIQERLNAYVEVLTGLLQDSETTIRTSAIQILLSLQKHLSASLRAHASNGSDDHPQFHVSHFRKIVNALILCPPSHRSAKKKQKTHPNDREHLKIHPDVRDWFVEKSLNVFDDIRWFFLREVSQILRTNSSRNHTLVVDNVLSILERLTNFPSTSSNIGHWWVEDFGRRPTSKLSQDNEDVQDEAKDAQHEEEDDWRKFFEENSTSEATDGKTATARLHTMSIHQHLHSIASHKAVFTRAWLSLLSNLSSTSAERSRALSMRVLDIMHRAVLPHLTRPVLVMDWVGSCVDYGGSLGLLALNTLFVLMKEYNLDYPSFYTRLYSFLDRDLLHLKHRSRFFRLTDLFLSSTHLPAVLVASFVKRLSRLSLNAPPSAIVVIIPFTYNMLRRHPSLMQMIHRTSDSEVGDDAFDMNESNPMLTNALESSLWELYSHRTHYHAAIATLASIFEDAFTKNSYAMEDFMDHTYMTIFETEAKKKIGKEPVVNPDRDSRHDLTEMWSIS